MKALKIIKWVVLGIAIFTLVILIVMYLWNWLVPVLFNGPVITFWQAAGLLLLSKILFGFGRKGPGGHYNRKHRIQEKLSRMSPEEREAFKSRIKARWCRSEDRFSPPQRPEEPRS